MNRFPRRFTSLNPPESKRFFLISATAITGSPLRRRTPNKLPFFTPRLKFPPPNFNKIATFITNTIRPDLKAMDSSDSETPPPPPQAPAGEDYVHIENPIADAGAGLSDSIVNVADELRKEEEEVKEQQQHLEQKEEKDDQAAASGSGRVGNQGEVGGKEEEIPDVVKSLTVLTCDSKAEGGACNVYLVGTAHVSQESCREVQAVVSYLKPEVVFLELCSSRVAVLSAQNLKVPTMAEMIDMWKKKHNMFGILYSWFLAKVANQLEVFPGSEFRVAYEEAKKYGARVILGDRPVEITLRRTWRRMPLWDKTKLVYSLLFQSVFLPSPDDLNKMLKDMDDTVMLTLVIQEMSEKYPTLMETLINERDQYMSSTLLKVASEHSLVVAVIGKGHVQGIQKHWKQPVEMKDLLEIPSQKPLVSATGLLKSVAVAVAGVAIVSGIYLACKK